MIYIQNELILEKNSKILRNLKHLKKERKKKSKILKHHNSYRIQNCSISGNDSNASIETRTRDPRYSQVKLARLSAPSPFFSFDKRPREARRLISSLLLPPLITVFSQSVQFLSGVTGFSTRSWPWCTRHLLARFSASFVLFDASASESRRVQG